MLSEKGEELFYKHLFLVEIYSNKLARHRGEKDDLYQQGSIGLLEAIKRYDAEIGDFKPFAISYIVSFMKEHFKMSETIKLDKRNWKENKKQFISLEIDLIDLSSEVEEKYIRLEELRILEINIKKLNNNQKLIIKLMLQGKRVSEIAQILKCTRQNVYKSFNHAVDELKGMML